MTNEFYRAFEDRHRGSRESVQQRQRTYLPFLAALQADATPPLLVDLGCGRGEWLELARGAGWHTQGADLDAAMLATARAAGLDVHEADALEFTARLPDASVSALTAFHVAEHLPFERLHALVRDARRVLRPGGLLVLETPNPENLQVGSSAFYMDPTHQRPLPPPLLAFLVEYAGFAQVTTLRLHEGIGERSRIELIDVLAGVSPDYAVLAVAPGGPSNPQLEQLLSRGSGVTLNELAARYDAQLEVRLRQAQAPAEMNREVGVGFLALHREVNDKLEAMERRLQVAIGLEQQAIDRLFHDGETLLRRAEEARSDAARLAARLDAMTNSASWRLTAPLRWIGAGKRHAFRLAGRALEGAPGLKRRLRSVAVRLRLVPPYAHAEGPAPIATSAPVAQPAAGAAAAPMTAARAPEPEAPVAASARRVRDILLDERQTGPRTGDS